MDYDDTKVRCPRCYGLGRIEQYRNIQDGVCFLCWGSGQASKRASADWLTTNENRSIDPAKKAQTDAALMDFGRTYGMATYDLLFALSEQSADRYQRALASLRNGRGADVAEALRAEFGEGRPSRADESGG